MVVNTFFSTPGQMDKNVARAWAQWLLREDDSPQTILDAVMNGLALGSIYGGGADALHASLQRLGLAAARDHVFFWTWRGAGIGCAFSTFLYCSLQMRLWQQPLLASDATARSELIADPWAREDPKRP